MPEVGASNVGHSGNEADVVTRAVIRAARRLHVTPQVLGAVIGVSEETVCRMERGEFRLEPESGRGQGRVSTADQNQAGVAA